jgi:sarcosine oxidase
VHLGSAEVTRRPDALPCLFDGPVDGAAGIYAMPTPGVGYKIGVDHPLRELAPGDLDRTPDPAVSGAILDRATGIMGPGQRVVDAHVCCWTDSPDGWFVIDRADAVVVACGDSGKGFKYSPVIGEVLADLAEGGDPDLDVAAMSAQRFAGLDPGASWLPTSLGGVVPTSTRE